MSEALRGLMCGEPAKRRFAVFVALFLVTVALYFTPAGTVYIGELLGRQNGFGLLAAFAPVMMGVLLLGIGYGTALGVSLGIAILLRSQYVPSIYFESLFKYPFTSIVPVLIAVVLAAVLFALLRNKIASEKRSVGIAVLILCCLLVMAVFCLGRFYCLVARFPYIVDDPSIEGAIASTFELSTAIEILAHGLLVSAACIVAFVAYRRKEQGLWARSMRSVFHRWLLLFVSVAFITTLSITFTYETIASQQSTKDMLERETDYLQQQIDDHEARQAQLSGLERDVILERAHAAARLISQDPSALGSTESMDSLASLLGLDSLTVTDASGMVVADADGVGIGVYNFATHDQTSRYMAIVSNPAVTVVEEPRASLDAAGTATDTYSLFAGVARTDTAGIVQVSIPASEYMQVLSAASIEHMGENYQIGTNGGIIIVKNDIVVTASLSGTVGATEGDVMDLGEDSYDTGKTFTIYDDEAKTYSLAYATRYGDYRLLAYIPVTEVYASRDAIMAWGTILYLVLFTVVFLLASRLLSTVVIDGIQKANTTLGRITEGDLDQRVNVHSNLEFDSLSDGINTTVDALKDSIAEASARIDRELATAHAIQSSALPSTFPPFPEISDFDIYASMNAAREVGGDFYDFFLIDDNRLGFVIADVSGKGIPAALFMMTAKTEIQNYMMTTDDDLGGAISTVNHHLCIGNDAGMFVTAFLAILDFHTGELTYVNAGHNPPLLRHQGTWEWVRDKSGLFLGAMDDIRYRSFARTLERGDELLLYTDGVTEAWNKDDQIYGEPRLLELLQSHANLHPTGLIHKLENNLAQFEEDTEQADDITMLSLEYGEAPDVSDSIMVPARIDQLERVLGFVHGELARRLCPIKEQKQLDIAIEELFVNIAHYAYPDATDVAPGMAKISYTYNATPPSIMVELSDSGIPYDPLKRDDPQKPKDFVEAQIGGLGIMMAKKSVDDIDYRYENGCNIITFSKSW